MQNDIYALIVIYNKNCNDSISYKCLKNISDINLIVCDNSGKDYGNQNIVLQDKYTYINMGGNKGLSKAYNKTLEILKGKEGWLCLFDDDTEIPKEYFDEVKSNIKDDKNDILLPCVIYERGLMSPVVLKKYAVKKVGNIESIDKSYIAGINSGMVINLSLIKDYKYDENLFLDYVDYNFNMDMREKNARLKVMDAQLVQSFSNDVQDKKSSKIRFKIKKKDLKHFYRKNFVSRLYYFYLIFRLKVGLILKFKDISIIGW